MKKDILNKVLMLLPFFGVVAIVANLVGYKQGHPS